MRLDADRESAQPKRRAHVKQTLFVLAAGSLQVPAITTARRMGLRVVALDGDADASGLGLADVADVVNITDVEACLAVAQRERVNGVIHICSEVSMHVMGAINEAMGLRGIDRETAVRATNKAAMRAAFEGGGAPSPRYRPAASEEEALAAAQVLGFPLILKPSRNSGSRGVTQLSAEAGNDAIVRAFRRAYEESRDRSVVIEQFVEGPEFSVEILTWNGRSHILAVTDKVTTGAPHFVETGHSQPTRLTDADRRRVEQAALDGVRALGIDWAAAHAEVRLSPDGPFLMEIGARLGGDFITTELVPRSTGIDMVEGAIRLALGEEPDLRPRHAPQGAAIRYLQPRCGTVRRVEGVDAARQMDGVRIVDVTVRPGDIVPPITSSLTRVGHVIAEGPSADAAIARAEAACDRIRIVTD